MNVDVKTIMRILLLVIFLIFTPYCKINAQNVTEPPIPIYIVCPYHQDSLRNAYENSLTASGSALAYAIKKYDTLQIQAQKASAENTAHFIWLYALIALLGTMNIILLFSTSRIRKELAQMKRLEHQQKLITSLPPVESPPFPQFQEALFSQDLPETHKPVRTRRTPTRKPRI
jgi:hypothetical protein